MGNFKDITNQKFGRLLAVKKTGDKYRGTYIWECLCDCGQVVCLPINQITSGNNKSCGCLNTEKRKVNISIIQKKSITHGMTGTRFYKIWTSINNRCTNKRSYAFKNYGGRGIQCLWQSFAEFKNDMHESYIKHIRKFGDKNTTIDRVDVNGNYCKENCRWATVKEQMNNKRNNVYFEYKGTSQTLSAWAEKLNISGTALRYRVITSKDLNKVFHKGSLPKSKQTSYRIKLKLSNIFNQYKDKVHFLDKRLGDIINLRYEQGKSLREVGKIHDLSKSRVHQLEKRAFEILIKS